MTAHRDWIEPMAATLTHHHFAGPDWLFERKYDGMRLLGFRRGADVQRFSADMRSRPCPPPALE